MSTYGQRMAARRARNARSLGAFGVAEQRGALDPRSKLVRNGNGVTIFSIGYEGRTGEELLAQLVAANVNVLVDVRERPTSRKADFRRSMLDQTCRLAGVRYEAWADLGSTGHQREQLRRSRDMGEFRRRFRDLARRRRSQVLDSLARLARRETVALLCYERVHEECHRSVVADLVADRIGATVVALL